MANLKKFVKWFDLCAAALALIALLLMFAPAITYVKDGADLSAAYINDVSAFNGFQTIFGAVKNSDTGYLAFSFLNFLTLIFVVAAIVLLVLNNFGKGFKFLNLVAAGLLLVAGVFFFLTLAFTFAAENPVGSGVVQKGIYKENWALGVGAILSGVFALLGAGVSGCKLLIK